MKDVLGVPPAVWIGFEEGDEGLEETGVVDDDLCVSVSVTALSLLEAGIRRTRKKKAC